MADKFMYDLKVKLANVNFHVHKNSFGNANYIYLYKSSFSSPFKNITTEFL